MSEKVKLPKDICDVLDTVKNIYVHYQIIQNCSHQEWTKPYEILNMINGNYIMRALVLGYEPELTAEEQLKERYENRGNYCTYEHFQGYRDGVKDTLHLHGIKYDWLSDDAE